jgi:hypothetical protein
VKHIRQISVTPALAFEVQPSIFLRVLEFVLQNVLVAQLQEKKGEKAAG